MAMKTSLLALIVAVAAVAQVPQPPQPPQPPSDSAQHGVARLSLFQGNVSVRHGDAGEATAAAINAPLVTTDRVVTGDGRAEIQFDAMNMIRLGASSEVRLSELQYKLYQVQIAEGTVTFRVLRDNDAQVEVSTPTVSLRPARAGTYRVTVRPDGTTQLTVRQGAAEIFGPRGSENLAAGQTMEARGTPNDPEFQIVAGIPSDEWDRWNSDRDRNFQQVSSGRNMGPNVSPDIYGTESLDPYGQWQNDPQYGNVWVPSVGPDWAPYQAGRWAYVDYYGWTWVSADPWGWAPYHYGRWFRGSYGWGWWPGPFGTGPDYWSPALVGFFGWGGGVGVGVGFGFGFGNVGWVPLAPFEVYRPWYGRGFAGGGIVNVNVVNTFRNARFAGAISSVRAGEFGRGAVVAGNMVRPTSGDLARGGMVNGAMPFSRSAASGRFSDAAVSSRGTPQATANRQFYSRQAGASRAAGASSNAGGWRRLNGNTPGGNAGGANSGGASPQARGPASTPAGQARGYSSSPESRAATPSRATSQGPVRINPPIVQNRGSSGGSPQSRPSGGSGGGHASGGGGGHGGGHR
jgi:hypothetical protein